MPSAPQFFPISIRTVMYLYLFEPILVDLDDYLILSSVCITAAHSATLQQQQKQLLRTGKLH